MSSHALEIFIDQNQKQTDQNIHGALQSLATAQALNSGSPINVLRRRGLGISIDGTTDGIFVDAFLGPINQNYWEDFGMKVWFDYADTDQPTFVAIPRTAEEYLNQVGLTAQQIIG